MNKPIKGVCASCKFCYIKDMDDFPYELWICDKHLPASNHRGNCSEWEVDDIFIKP